MRVAGPWAARLRFKTERLFAEKRVTCILGILNNDGIVMASDTEETAEVKLSVQKMMMITNQDKSRLIVAGAGPGYLADTITEALWREFESATAKEVHKFEDGARRIIKSHYRDHVLAWPSVQEREDNDFSLLLAAAFPVTGSDLYNHRMWISQKGTLRNAIALPCVAIGTGANYAKLLLKDFLGMHALSFDALLAIYTLQQVKQTVPYVGKHTHVWVMRGDRTRPVMPEVVSAAEHLFGKYEGFRTAHFLATVGSDPTTHDLKFEMEPFQKAFAGLAAKIDAM